MSVEDVCVGGDDSGQQAGVDLDSVLVAAPFGVDRCDGDLVAPCADQAPSFIRDDDPPLVVDRLDGEVVLRERHDAEEQDPTMDFVTGAPRPVDALRGREAEHPGRDVDEGVGGLCGGPDDVCWGVEGAGDRDGVHASNMRILLVSRNSHFARSAEPRKRPSQARSRETVGRILDEAARLFDVDDYRNITTNHVAAAAGISVGSLYQYFPNKDALLVGLADRHLEEVTPRLVELAEELRAQAPPVDVVCARFVTEVADLNASSRLHSLLWAAPRTQALIDRLAALEKALIAEVAWHLQRFGHSSDLAPIRARILVTAIDAAVHDLDPGSDRHVQVEELIRLAVLYATAS